MSRRKRKYVRSSAKIQEVTQKHPKTGVNTTFAVLPLDDLVEDFVGAGTPPQKIKIRDKLFGLFRREASERTSIAPDEKTTQMGTISFGDLGVTRGFYERTRLEHVRRAKYRDYDRIDAESTVGQRALDVTVNNAFLSEQGDHESYQVDSKDGRVLNILKDLEERTELKDEAPGMMRTGLKYGDGMEELCFDPSNRLIVRLNWLNPMHTERNEDEFGRLDATKAFVQRDAMGQEIAGFHFFQVSHTRYNHRRGNKYGTSFYDSSRRPFKIRHVMEEGVAINRISRAVDRIAFYIPVPKGSPQFEKEKIVEDAKRNFKKRVAVDSEGKMDLTRAPFGDAEDIFIGVEGKDSPAKVETMKGSSIIGQLGDVEYFQNMEIMGYGVPKSYLQIERDVNAKATLGHEDIEFGRMIQIHRKKFSKFLRDVYRRQLDALGIPPRAEQFTIMWPAISFIDEKMRSEIMLLKWQIAALAKQTFGIPTPWLLSEVIGLDDDAIGEIEAGMQEPPPGIAPGANPFGGQPEIGRTDREAIKQRYFGDRRLAAEIHELKNLIHMVQAERLNQPLAA